MSRNVSSSLVLLTYSIKLSTCIVGKRLLTYLHVIVNGMITINEKDANY
jgi:hypothetical protein